MGLFDKFIPKDLKEALDEMNGLLKKIFADQQASNDMDIILAAAAPLFGDAAKSAATEELKTVFNDVAIVLPFFREVLKRKNLPILEAAKLISTFRRLGNGGLKRAFEEEGAEISVIYKKLLEDDAAQAALGRVLVKPVGQDLFTLQEKDGKHYVFEQLSGASIKFPVREEIFNSVKAERDKKPPAPKGPAGPGL